MHVAGFRADAGVVVLQLPRSFFHVIRFILGHNVFPKNKDIHICNENKKKISFSPICSRQQLMKERCNT